MNDPKTCAFRKKVNPADVGEASYCIRPRDLGCLCGIDKAVGLGKPERFHTGGFVPAPGPQAAAMMRDDPGLSAVVRPVDLPGEVTLYGGARGGGGKYGDSRRAMANLKVLADMAPEGSYSREALQQRLTVWSGTDTGRMPRLDHPGSYARLCNGGRPRDDAETVPAVLELDFAELERRVVYESGFAGLVDIDPTTWDNWKPGRDVA